MSNITHYDGCWQDPKHHACALREIERLRDDLQRATSMPMATEAARNVALEKKVDQQQAEIERLTITQLELGKTIEKQANDIEKLRAEVVDVTRRLGRTRLRIVRALEQIRHMPGADNETAYEMRKIAAEALGHE